MSDFIKLSEIADTTVGFVGTMAKHYKEEGVPFLRSLNVDRFFINETDIKFISEEFNAKLKKSMLRKNDILIVRTGNPGTCCVVPNEYIGANCSDVVIVRPNTRRVNPYYLAGYINVLGQKQINNNKVGAVQKHFNVHSADEMLIKLPSLEVQNKIANVLTVINMKISTNRQINDNLQQQIMLIYDYWFTQFDFPDKDNKPYQSSGGKMVWNDTLKRNIPENWFVQSVASNDLTEILKPGVEKFDVKTYLATADVKGCSISVGTLIDYENRESRANMQPTKNSVWFAKMKNSIKHLYLNEEMTPIIANSILSTGFCGLQCSDTSFEYVASYISSPYFEIHKDMLAHGATQEAVNNDDLIGIKVVIPDEHTLTAFQRITQPIYAQISRNICENQELVKLRDWLLPMLMNGQATISD